MTQKIMIVDDDILSQSILTEMLKDEFELITAMDGKEALEKLSENEVDLILLDIVMPRLNGIDFIKLVAKDINYDDLPIIFFTYLDDIKTKNMGLSLGAVDYITKPFNDTEVLLKIRNHLNFKMSRDLLSNNNKILKGLVKRQTRELEEMQEAIIQSLAVLAETRDSELAGHIKRTKEFATVLAKKILESHPNLSKNERNQMKYMGACAPLHDIGKISIPDSILFNPSKLSSGEFKTIKSHTIEGYKVLESIERQVGSKPFLTISKTIALSHHEKWDGSGYPNNLKEKDIPISARLMAIIDVYDALISKRVYKEPINHSKAIEIILEQSGTHFDPQLVELFMSEKYILRLIALKFADYEDEKSALKK